MKARKLIESASYGPETLKALYQAFDEAWTIIAPRYGNDEPAIEVARIRLANIVLGLARDDSRDVASIRDAALQHYQVAAGGR